MTGADYLREPYSSTAHRWLTAKAIAEFSHERMLQPVPITHPDACGNQQWHIQLASGTQYRFEARQFALLHWRVRPSTITRDALDKTTSRQAVHDQCVATSSAAPAQQDVQLLEPTADPIVADVTIEQFVLDARAELGLTDRTVTTYLEEISATFAARCYTLAHPGPSSNTLLCSGFQAVERAMNQGHPGFLATNGRIGFAHHDYLQYAPEASAGAHPLWMAAEAAGTGYWTSDSMQEQQLPDPVPTHIGNQWRSVAAQQGLTPESYVLMPVHPWQWQHKIARSFASDVAARRLVLVGQDPDLYYPQQSLRTWFNATDPTRPYLKMALSIQNMGFLRGLSPSYMSLTPAINDFVHQTLANDVLLKSCNFAILREYATVGYTADAYHATKVRSAHTKMIAALWRESPITLAPPECQLVTLASLLHVDPAGKPFVRALVEASGMRVAQWLAALFRAYVVPLVHVMTQYGMVFMPHGENIILIVREGTPCGAFLKDIGEEVVVASGGIDVPTPVRRICHNLSEEELSWSFFTDIMDGVLRHVAGVMVDDGLCTQQAFWAILKDSLHETDALNVHRPGVDLFRPSFPHSCLNRLQLREPGEMVDLSDPTASLQFAGSLQNPLIGMPL